MISDGELMHDFFTMLSKPPSGGLVMRLFILRMTLSCLKKIVLPNPKPVKCFGGQLIYMKEAVNLHRLRRIRLIGWATMGSYRSLPDLASLTQVIFDGGLRLLGYDAPPIEKPGQPFCVTLYWEIDKPITQDLTVFLHLSSADGFVQAQRDSILRLRAFIQRTNGSQGRSLLICTACRYPEGFRRVIYPEVWSLRSNNQ